MSDLHSGILPKNLLTAVWSDRPHAQVSRVAVDSATIETESVFARFSTCLVVLTNDEAIARRAKYGPNVLAKERRTSFVTLVWHLSSTSSTPTKSHS